MAKKKTAKKKSTKKAIPFEQSLEQLRSIVRELEGEQLSLDASLEKYESGVKHLKECYAALQKAERRIEMLVDLDASGNLVTKPVGEATADDDDEEFEQQARDELSEETDPEMDDSERLF